MGSNITIANSGKVGKVVLKRRENQIRGNRLSFKVIAGILVTLFFGVALYLRIALPYDQIFSGAWIKFAETDAYYHIRLVENLLHHFPHYITFDPYTFYPHGANVAWPPFFDWLLAGITWLIGLGSPDQHTVDLVGVYFPAVLGALTVVPVYFIGKELFNRWVGVLAAGLMAITPGEFLGRSILGFTDHHAAEVLFTTVTILFLILAIKTARQRRLNFSHLRHRDWAVVTKPLVYSLLTGIFLGIYLLTWVGGLLFVFLISAYFVVQSIIDHWKRQPAGYLAIVGSLLMLVAAGISLTFLPETVLHPMYLPSFIIAVVIPVALAMLSRVIAARNLAVAYYPLALLGLGLAGLAVFYAISPTLVKSMVGQFKIFTPAGAALTITEVQPLLFPQNEFSLSLAWGIFTTGFFLSLIALGILIYLLIKRGEADKTFLVVWSLVMLAATLGQRRFAYYFAVNVALLTGYISWQILQFAGLKETAPKLREEPRMMKKKKAKLKKPGKRGFRLTASGVSITLGVIFVFFLTFFPNISPATTVAKAVYFAPDDAWCESLSWLKENTPDPFGNPDFYYELYQPPPPGENYKYPESAYGVMAWWDYGHLITRIAHRVPISNPFQQGAGISAQFFTAQNEASASKIAGKLASRYVIVDYATAITKFYALPTWAGGEAKFWEVYYQPQGDRLVPVRVFYPEYYRSLAVRLYNFDGGKVSPQNCAVVSYEEKRSREGVAYKEVIHSQSFPSYKEAEAYISKQKSGNHRIVGTSPFISPVPLEKLKHYKLIYSSTAQVKHPDIGLVPAIKIFEYQR